MSVDRMMTVSLRDARLIRVLEAALDAVEPGRLVKRFLETAEIPSHARCFLLGIGKAAEAMTRGAAEAIGTYQAALVVTKHRSPSASGRLTVLQAGHPIPDERSVAAGQAVLDFVTPLEAQDLLLCLISGGGSSLVSAPVNGISLKQLQDLSANALASGADIGEINNLRRCLDRVKGGGLAFSTKARILGLVLSDVIGDSIEAVASGPTVPIQPDPVRALGLLDRLHNSQPAALRELLMSWRPRGVQGVVDRTQNVIIGNAATAAMGALEQASREGFDASVMHMPFEGEARHVGLELGHRLTSELEPTDRPRCVIAVGESTVSLSKNHGMGGRNQELALAAVDPLAASDNHLLIALATDGEDGPTDAAGAVVTGRSAARGEALGMRPQDYLERHDAYHYFESLGDLLRPGPTGTNVNDMVLLFAL